MNIYLTSGSMEFMESARKRYPNEMMIAMHGVKNTVLMHETAGKSVFSTPQAYKVISSTGQLTEVGFFALNYIPIEEDARPIFEYQFKTRVERLENERGLIAIRLLQPTKSDTYVVLTQWEDAHTFNIWRNSASYKYLLEDSEATVGAEKRLHIFSSAPYVRTYKSKEEDD